MTDHRTPDARCGRRTWGGFYTSGPGPENWEYEYLRMKTKVEALQKNKWHLMGEQLDDLSVKELQQLEQQLETSLTHTRSRRNKLMLDTISEFQSKSSSGKSSTSHEDCSSSFRNWQSSTETKGSSNVIGLRSDNEVSSGKSNMLGGNWSAGFIADSMRKSSPPLRLQVGQTSSQTLKDRSNLRGSGSDSQVSSGKSNVPNEDRTSRSSAVTYRNKSPQRPRLRQSSPEMVKGSTHVGGPESKFEEHLFDICRSESTGTVQLKKSFLELNRERKRECEQFKLSHQPKYLRSGMVLLKNYISLKDQETIIKSCRELGIGKGGFYQPGYRNGRKLHLKMMCLGKYWDPESRMYGDYHSINGARPPEIPVVFRSFVEGAIKAAHDLIRENNRYTNVEYELPKISPDICIVNFYSNTGKLGLHQDIDESPESIAKGVPIVSFSVGDSAEFLYGDKRDVDTAEKLVLESGDVLIFGGKSRSLFHGVSSISPNTAPKSLVEKIKLRPGRLNLTFRQL